jgi:hypothetical protein
VLDKCANPFCFAQFRYLQQGRLFEVETRYLRRPSIDGQHRLRNGREHLERYWLCDTCATYIALQFDRERGIVAVALRRGSGKTMVAAIPQLDSEAPAEVATVLIRPVDLNWIKKRESKEQTKAQGSVKVA